MEIGENGRENSSQHAELMIENPSVAQARELVLTYGWNSTSFQIVNPGITRWFAEDGEAVVGYVPAAGYRIVAGAPVCSEERLEEIVETFEADARKCGQKVCYFCAEGRLEEAAREVGGHTKFLLGAQPTWNPKLWPSIIATHKSLRAQLNRARNKKVTVTEFSPERAAADVRLEACLHDWLASKGLPPLHFLVEPETLRRLEHRRVFVAELARDVVGFVTLSPVSQRQGWLFEQFPHRSGAPNGTVELMIDAAMHAIADDGCEYATLGLAPLSRRAAVEPFHNPFWLEIALAWVRKHGQRFYNFDGLDAFKAKLRPDEWEPVFALSNEAKVSPRSLYAIASAFSGNAPVKTATAAILKAVSTEFHWLGQKFRAGVIHAR
jgi:phosphatidylglycerol lysyltransferase